MEHRQFDRKKYRFKAYFISGSTKYLGCVENFSEEGIFFTAAPTTTPITINISSHPTHEIQLHLSSGETLIISGEVKQFHTETSPYGLIHKIGIKIINPPKQYREFLKTYC